MKGAVAGFIRSALAHGADAGAVEAQALALFRWQRAHNPEYAAFAGDGEPCTLAAIPAVPVALFRDLALTCFPPEEARIHFHTSGTSTGRPGVHRLRDTDVYDVASEGWFQAMVPACPRHAVSLVPPPWLAPRSSLSHMVGRLFPTADWLATGDGRVDPDRTWRTLAGAREPVFVAATALALALLLEEGAGATALPAGSMVMVTGGFKGRALRIDGNALLDELRARLGPETALVGEYGMTELSSQLWTRPGGLHDPTGPFHPPPWLVPVVVDPGSGVRVPVGTPGQLRFVDLANHETVVAIETMDEGTLAPDGSLRLHGRLPGAPARGCSLTVEEASEAADPEGPP